VTAAAPPPPEPSQAGGYGQGTAVAPVEKRSAAKAAAKPAADKADAAPVAAAPVAAAKEQEQDRYRAAADEAQGSNVAPQDYNSSFYTAYPDIAAAYGAAIRLEASGRYAEAVAAFSGFLTSTRSDVAQDAAWHVGRSLRALGRLDDALTTVSAGLKRGSTNTPYRSNLYALQGDLYGAQGRSTEAQKAWAEAARLNAARR
jgi:predicted negative regulator of RcsB-dependent stress response